MNILHTPGNSNIICRSRVERTLKPVRIPRKLRTPPSTTSLLRLARQSPIHLPAIMSANEGEKSVLPQDVKVEKRRSDSEFDSVDDSESLELTPAEHRRLRRIVDWRILPYLSLLYLLSMSRILRRNFLYAFLGHLLTYLYLGRSQSQVSWTGYARKHSSLAQHESDFVSDPSRSTLGKPVWLVSKRISSSTAISTTLL